MSIEPRYLEDWKLQAFKAVAIACAMAFAAPAVHAETPTVPQAFTALRQSSTYRQAVFAGSQRSGAWVVNSCAGATTTLGDRLSIGTPPRFDDKGQPTAGAWIEHVTVDGCGGQRLLNVLVVARGPGQLATVPLLPGSTRANPILQRDGAVYAYAAAGVRPNGCKPIYILDTTFLGLATEPPAVPGKAAWSERWTVVQCDRRVPVVLHFIPGESGTAIVVDKIVSHP